MLFRRRSFVITLLTMVSGCTLFTSDLGSQKQVLATALSKPSRTAASPAPSRKLASSDSPSIVCGADVVNNPNVDATPALQACFAAPVSVINLVPGRYYVNSTLDLSNRSGVTLQTLGVNSGPACLSPGAAPCAVLTASATNRGPRILNSVNSSNMKFLYFALDGNIALRRKNFSNADWVQGMAYNAVISACWHCEFRGFASIRTAKGTGLDFDGDGAVFDTVVIRDNGWGAPNNPQEPAWSDGLTIGSANNLRIVNSVIMDNSDVDLIIGNGQNAVIENNIIGNSYNFAFAAFMLDNFNNATAGNFNGTEIRNNTIACGSGMCGIGIDVGPHMWYPSRPVIGGSIHDNQVNGARQGILTAGANGTQIYSNTINADGDYMYGSLCSAVPFSISDGDSVSASNNNYPPVGNSLKACGPTQFPSLLRAYPGVSPQISQLYRDVLGRDFDLGGGIYFTTVLNSGVSLDSLRAMMASAPESVNNINALYQTVLGRQSDPGGLQSWIGYLSRGGTLAQLRIIFETSGESLGKYDATY